MQGGTPTQLGPYEIRREIGRGGMGVVYLARDERLDRHVAIKALPEHFANDPARLERFQREARTLAQLNHANVAGIYGVEQHEGAQYLILEYVEGETLANVLDRGPLNVHDTVEICTKITLGVEAAHEAGIIHRDLKPENIKITPGGHVKVLDFGLARTEEQSTSSLYNTEGQSESPTLTSPVQHSPTIPGAILGTAAYMSPEQARGRQIDKRTDIWSFGVILYECLTGSSPFVGETASDSIGAVLHKHVDMDRLPAETPAGIRRILSRCVERDRNLRYRDMGDVRIELNRALSETVEATERAESTPGRSALHYALVVLLIVVFSVAGYLAALALQSPVAQPVARLDAVVETDDIKLNGSRPKVSPDGRLIAYIQPTGIHVRDIASFDSRILSGTSGALNVFWSPDGRSIGYTTERAVHKVALTGNTSIKLTGDADELDDVSGGTWTDDDRIIYGTTRRGILSVSARGGEPVSVLDVDSATLIDYHDVTIIPGTQVLLYIEHRRDMSFALVAWDGERKTIIIEVTNSYLSHPAWSPTGHILFSRAPRPMSIWAAEFDVDRMEVVSEPFLVEPTASQPSVSRTGTLVFRRGGDFFGGGNLAWVTRTGKLETIEGEFDAVFKPVPSPDGKRIAFSGGTPPSFDVWVRDLERQVNSRMTFYEDMSAPIAWSADGSELTIARLIFGNDPPARTEFIYSDGSGESRPGVDGATFALSRDWTLAGKVLDPTAEDAALTAYSPADPNAPEKEVMTLPFGFDAVALNPDGTLLAYTSDESGENQVYCTRYPDATGKWQVSINGGSMPLWSANGTRLYFQASENGSKEVHEVDVTLDPSLRFGIPTKILDGAALGLDLTAGWHPSADDERFIVVRDSSEREEVQRSISLIQNWYEEHRDR